MEQPYAPVFVYTSINPSTGKLSLVNILIFVATDNFQFFILTMQLNEGKKKNSLYSL